MLSPREQEILTLMMQGLSSKQIADKLKISKKTVDNHRSKMLKKTGALNSTSLISNVNNRTLEEIE